MGGPLRLAAGLLALVLWMLASAGCGAGGHSAGGHSAGDGSASSTPGPALEIVSYAPLIIRGQHFRPGESVIVQAQSRQRRIRPVDVRERARTDGAFTVQLHGYGLDRCTGFTITATASSGSRAVVRSPASGCPPVPAPST